MGNLSWSQGDSQTKKKELGAYRMLGLGREMKSIRRRSASDQAGLYRYIGEGTVERPWLKVTRAEYLETRRGVEGAVLGRRKATDADLLRIERKTYDLLGAREAAAAGLREAFRQAHGRGMTPREQEMYSKAAGEAGMNFKPDPRARAAGIRRRLLAEVVEKVENRARGGEEKNCRSCGRRWRERRRRRSRCWSMSTDSKGWLTSGVSARPGGTKLGGGWV